MKAPMQETTNEESCGCVFFMAAILIVILAVLSQTGLLWERL
jgi:hypothetical protein